MRRKLRWIVTIASGIFFVAALTALVRSYWASEFITVAVPRVSSESARTVVIGYSRDGLLIYFHQFRASITNTDSLRHVPRDTVKLQSLPFRVDFDVPMFVGFGLKHGLRTRLGIDELSTSVVLPLWFVATIAGAGLLAGVIAIRRALAVSRSPTLCKSCGYDLRAGHDKCPECGGESHVKVGAAVG